MKIRNINVDEALAKKALDCFNFILDVIRVCDEPNIRESVIPISVPVNQLPHEPIWKLEANSCDDVATMIHQIPIYLVKGCGEEYREDKLGAYCMGRNGASPYIKVYVEAINQEVQNDYEFKWLFTIVLLHEVMHAVMDPYNNSHLGSRGVKINCNTNFGKFREEALANAGAFAIIQKYAKEPNAEKGIASYAQAYMEAQGTGYNLGVKYTLIHTLWYNLDWMIDVKMNGVHPKLQKEWVDYVQQPLRQIVIRKLREFEQLLQADCVYEYDNHYYTCQMPLVLKLVRRITSEKGKMSYAELLNLIPNDYIQSEPLFVTMPCQVVNGCNVDYHYWTKPAELIELSDAVIAVRSCWNSTDLKKLIMKIQSVVDVQILKNE